MSSSTSEPLRRGLRDRRSCSRGPRRSRQNESGREDVRGVSRGLERFLLSCGEHVVRVPPKLMAGARKSSRAFGKSYAIDALAIARAALAHPDLPVAVPDEAARDLRLLIDHREALVRQRSEAQDRLRWLLHDIEPDLARLRLRSRFSCPSERSPKGCNTRRAESRDRLRDR